ncbi:hypothetical protein BB450_07235 [Helicobacter pylori]|uniref:hypothetical protein n=1 Tax=Helicobacter pylori TaxID=210 RepID=UPI000BEA30A8|nr:hypothetical protein [Helicobacter pylori]PDW30727.1 hypothetical protein BB450_07235 [Helicobacter pylori]
MEQEKLKPIDLEVLKDLNIDYYYTLKIFNKLEAKGLCDQRIINKKKEKETKKNYYKVCYLNDLGKDLCTYLNALKGVKNH